MISVVHKTDCLWLPASFIFAMQVHKVTLREAWGQHCTDRKLGSPGIRVSSGFRTPELNALLNDSPTSAHCSGYAFDLIPVNGNMLVFKSFRHDFF